MSISLTRVSFSLGHALTGIALALAGAAASATPAVVYAEYGDAGQKVGTAQTTVSHAYTLSDITGTLNGFHDVDLYLINIADLSAFSATTFNAGTDDLLDTQLFLLTASGQGVCLNDDDGADPNFFRSTISAGSCGSGIGSGLFILGIGSGHYDPLDKFNSLMFDPGVTSTDVRSAISTFELGGFNDNSVFPDNAGAYDIQLTGVGVAVVPEPASMLLVAAALAGCGWSSKKRRPRAAAADRLAA